MIKYICIQGIRSFKEPTKIDFAMPNGKPGSGLSIIVGANNSGKSTLIECLHQLTKDDNIFSSDFRNKESNHLAKIIAFEQNSNSENGNEFKLECKSRYSSIVERSQSQTANIYIISSQKRFSTFFSDYPTDRLNYIRNNIQHYRDNQNINQQFGTRLIDIIKNNKRKTFSNYLYKMLPNIPKWDIDHVHGQNFVNFVINNNSNHNSQGLGDGVINIFSLADALHDEDNKCIVIDEPEVSLHPDIQKNVMKLLIEESQNRQIIITTHSPYFIDFEVSLNNGKIFRFIKENDTTKFYKMSTSGNKLYSTSKKDKSNVRILGIEAKEVFFLSQDKPIIVTEGQDDVLYFSQAFQKANIDHLYSFFGWGSGGAGKIEKIASFLSELGYKKVVCIFDNNRVNDVLKLKKKFEHYLILESPAYDVKENKAHSNTFLFTSDYDVNPVFEKEYNEMLEKMNKYAEKNDEKEVVQTQNIECEEKSESNGFFYDNFAGKFMRHPLNIYNIERINKEISRVLDIDFTKGGGGYSPVGLVPYHSQSLFLLENIKLSYIVKIDNNKPYKIILQENSIPCNFLKKIWLKLLFRKINSYYKKFYKKFASIEIDINNDRASIDSI